MLTALARGKPDRMPITIHQFQAYELRKHLHGWDQVEAFRQLGLDASVDCWDALERKPSPDWLVETVDLGDVQGERHFEHRVRTPSGELRWSVAKNPTTEFIVKPPVTSMQEAERFLDYFPETVVNREMVRGLYDRTGDSGIVRGEIGLFAQSGPWQDFCQLAGTQEAIFWALDEPEEAHEILRRLTDYKIRHIYEQMPGLLYDLVECGGGAASSTVISPSMFAEFCLPYDRHINQALHEVGFRAVYHTCGGMMDLLELLPQNETDACETLSPPGVGGDIRPEDRDTVREVLGAKVALIGGIDQFGVLEAGTPEQIRAEVHACFETFGRDGGYICSASDHFFEAPESNLRALAQAALDCRYE